MKIRPLLAAVTAVSLLAPCVPVSGAVFAAAVAPTGSGSAAVWSVPEPAVSIKKVKKTKVRTINSKKKNVPAKKGVPVPKK